MMMMIVVDYCRLSNCDYESLFFVQKEVCFLHFHLLLIELAWTTGEEAMMIGRC
jgi:hypothetical protein